MNFDEFQIPKASKAYLISIVSTSIASHKNEKSSLSSLNELKELLRTLGIQQVGDVIQKKEQPDPATMLGKGKLQQIALLAKQRGADFLVCDFELTASQSRNIKKLTGLEVIDRVNIILEIFARHAKTKEAKLQIEISRLEYLLPRLTTLWTHFSKQRGGIGLKGEGEQQLELDRRIVRQKIQSCKKLLKEVQETRKQQKKRRTNQAITAALVGYTNAGKSSLMNRLCQVDVLEENKLFATLDSTFRTLTPDTKPPMILIDTVGFISNLPNTLITGFKTTLESALEADLLLIVCDLSDSEYEKHLEVTQGVLKELKLEKKEKFIIFNKRDKLNDPFLEKIAQKRFANSFVVSSFNKTDMKDLRRDIIDHFLSKQIRYDLFIPYEKGNEHSVILSKTNVINSTNHENGIFYQVRVPEFIFHTLGLNEFILSHEQAKDFF